VQSNRGVVVVRSIDCSLERIVYIWWWWYGAIATKDDLVHGRIVYMWWWWYRAVVTEADVIRERMVYMW